MKRIIKVVKLGISIKENDKKKRNTYPVTNDKEKYRIHKNNS